LLLSTKSNRFLNKTCALPGQLEEMVAICWSRNCRHRTTLFFQFLLNHRGTTF